MIGGYISMFTNESVFYVWWLHFIVYQRVCVHIFQPKSTMTTCTVYQGHYRERFLIVHSLDLQM